MAVHANSTGAPVVVRLPTAATKKVKQPIGYGDLAEEHGVPILSQLRRLREMRRKPVSSRTAAVAILGAPVLAMSALVASMRPTKKEAKACRRTTNAARDRLGTVEFEATAAEALGVLTRRCSTCGWCVAYRMNRPGATQ